MDNVSMQCGSCGQLMAVAESSLGQQVRCPHCQQVVLAPAAPPEPLPGAQPTVERPEFETRIAASGAQEIESIFASPELNNDALFGEPTRAVVEMPVDPLPPAPVDPPPIVAESPPVLAQTETALNFRPDSSEQAGVEFATDRDAGAFSLNPLAAASESASPAVGDADLARDIPAPRIRPPAVKGGWLLALLIVPLISYSVLATVAVIYLRFFQALPTNQPHPLEMIPDLEGENPGVRAAKKKVSVNFHGRQEKELPPNLRTKLGQAIRVGDLEIEPLSVQLRPIEFATPGSKPEASAEEALVLNLRLTNKSDELAFCPLDPYFERRWREVKGESKTGMPFTYLTVGKERFYGGPISVEEHEERGDTIKGQKLGHELKPGETFETFVCTNPEDSVKRAAEGAKGPMLWRVQVRRGQVRTPNRGEVSASAVVGIEFTRDQIKFGGSDN